MRHPLGVWPDANDRRRLVDFVPLRRPETAHNAPVPTEPARHLWARSAPWSLAADRALHSIWPRELDS
jgi:hypothetical protein